jgi:hypothetical protein
MCVNKQGKARVVKSCAPGANDFPCRKHDTCVEVGNAGYQLICTPTQINLNDGSGSVEADCPTGSVVVGCSSVSDPLVTATFSSFVIIDGNAIGCEQNWTALESAGTIEVSPCVTCETQPAD